MGAAYLERRPLRATLPRCIPMQVVQRAPYSFNVIAQQSDTAVTVLANNAADADPLARARDREQLPAVSRSTSRALRWPA